MRSGHRAVRLCHYRTFINNRLVFLFHLQILCLPPLITEPYHLLLPPEHGCRRYQLPLLCRHKSNIDLIVMYCVTLVWRHEIYSPIGSSPASVAPRQLGILPATVLTLRHPSSDTFHLPIMETIQQPHNVGGNNTQIRT